MLVALAAAALLLIALAFFFLRRKKNDSEVKPVQPQTKSTNGKSQEEVIQLEDPTNSQAQVKNAKKKKKKIAEGSTTSISLKTVKELQQLYGQNYYGCLSLRGNKTLSTITCLTIKNSKVLVGKSNNELVLFDLKKWKMHSTCQDHYFTFLDNNTATAVAISQNYYFAALDFEKTITYFEFKGGEGGIYFKEVKKFPRNIFKSNQGSLYVPEGQKFIVSTGVEADTSINVWSMRGQKLASVSSYQIEHYDVQYGGNYALIRGWTSEVKSFQFVADKEGSFAKLEKSFHLTLSQKPMASMIDNFGLHAIAITGDGEQIKFWELTSKISSHPTETTVQSCQIGLDQAKFCSVITVKSDNERLRTILIVASETKMVILNRSCKPIKEIEGLAIERLYSFGASKSAVFGAFANGKLAVWDFTKLTLQQPEYVHQG